MNIPVHIKKTLNLLENNGFEAYIVGGCVRDSLRKTDPNDWDVTTSATPDQILNVFNEYKCIETGKKHGTISVIIDSNIIEITTYRIDGIYSDTRHPDSVSFSSNIYDDLSRRDFTINAIAYNPNKGFVDLFEGNEDIQSQIIRCVGNPYERFKEDALRILRALRFSSQLSYTIDEKTKKAIIELATLLKNISKERIYEEMTKILCGKNVESVLLEYSSVFSIIIPELEACIGFEQNTPWHCYDVYTHIAKSVANIENKPIYRWTMLLHDVGKPEKYITDQFGVGHFYGHPIVSEQIARNRLKELHADTKSINMICCLIKNHDTRIELSQKSVLKLLNKLGKEIVLMLIDVQNADHKAQNPDKWERCMTYENEFKRILSEISEKGLCFTLKDLKFNGDDCKALGINDGIAIRNTLSNVLDAVINQKINNNKLEITEYVKKIVDT